MTKKELSEALEVLFGTFRHTPTSVELNGFWAVFGKHEAADLRSAVERALNECERFPVPAVLKRLLPKKDTMQYIGSMCLFHRNNPDKKAQEYDYTCERCIEICRSSWDAVPKQNKNLENLIKKLD